MKYHSTTNVISLVVDPSGITSALYYMPTRYIIYILTIDNTQIGSMYLE